MLYIVARIKLKKIVATKKYVEEHSSTIFAQEVLNFRFSTKYLHSSDRNQN